MDMGVGSLLISPFRSGRIVCEQSVNTDQIHPCFCPQGSIWWFPTRFLPRLVQFNSTFVIKQIDIYSQTQSEKIVLNIFVSIVMRDIDLSLSFPIMSLSHLGIRVM